MTSRQFIDLTGDYLFEDYQRENKACGILHMSIGGFHRSHQANYLNEYLKSHDENWGIHAVGLLDVDFDHIDKLKKQRCLYSLVERTQSHDEVKIIGSILKATHGPSDPQDVIDSIASSEIKIVSLTVTEKGYCYDSKGELDLDNAAIKEDLRNSNPKTMVGFLVAGLEARKKRINEPLTVLSCDNLIGNGNITKKIVMQFAQLKDASLCPWLEKNVSFPNSMVDRITPGVDQTTSDFVLSAFNIKDAFPVVSEGFSQWIIEDNFLGGRPELEAVGAQFVDNVEPYEKMKVRLLNGSHSALSYVAYLLGFRKVDLAMSDEDVRNFVVRYMEEVTPSLDSTPGIDIGEYKALLIERFSNPAISDAITRLAQDGSQKIPNAITPVISYQSKNEGSAEFLSFAICAWYRYLRGIDETGEEIEIVDPQSKRLIEIAVRNPGDISEFLNVQEIFGNQIGSNTTLAGTMKKHLDSINTLGVRQALRELLGSEKVF